VLIRADDSRQSCSIFRGGIARASLKKNSAMKIYRIILIFVNILIVAYIVYAVRGHRDHLTGKEIRFIKATNQRADLRDFVNGMVEIGSDAHSVSFCVTAPCANNVCFAHLNIYFHPSSSRPGYKCATAII
jgi:hypothetical protein